jgi:hypothetical protein
MKRIALLVMLVMGVASLGCGSKKAKVETGEAADAGAAEDKASADGMEPEANTGPTEYPTPPKRSSADRTPYKFKVSVTKAYVLPLSADGACFDKCPKATKDMLVEALPGLAGEQFGSAAKALTTAVGAKGSKEALPDIYVHLDCGFGQELTTHKTSAEDRLVANWRGAEETLKLDPKDQCAISVWDADDDGNDELIGDTVVPLIEVAKDGTAVITSEDNDFGQVYLVEIFLDQLEGPSVWKTPGTASGGSGGSTPGSGTTPTPAPTPPDPSGAANYKVEIVKANLMKNKKTGEPWDTKLPFVGKAGDEAPDPFVAAYINGYQSENPFMKTNPAENTFYTEWRQAGEAKLKPGDKIHFMVWDKDKVDNDLMGECITDPVGSLTSGQNITLKNCGRVDFLVVKITRK